MFFFGESVPPRGGGGRGQGRREGKKGLYRAMGERKTDSTGRRDSFVLEGEKKKRAEECDYFYYDTRNMGRTRNRCPVPKTVSHSNGSNQKKEGMNRPTDSEESRVVFSSFSFSFSSPPSFLSLSGSSSTSGVLVLPSPDPVEPAPCSKIWDRGDAYSWDSKTRTAELPCGSCRVVHSSRSESQSPSVTGNFSILSKPGRLLK